MSVKKGLIKKDLYNLSSYKTSLIIVFICMCILGTSNSTMMNYIPIIMATMSGMIALSTFSYDEIAKSNTYVLTLPTNKKEVIISKYILVISISLDGAIIGFLITPIIIQVMNAIKQENLLSVDWNDLLITTLGGIFGIALIESIQIPSIYKWGPEKGRIQMFILIFILILIIAGAAYLFIQAGFSEYLNAIETFLQSFGIPLLLIVTITLYYISYKVSCRIYLKQD